MEKKEKNSNDEENKIGKDKFPFGGKKKTIMVLNALLKYNQDVPDEYYSMMDSAVELSKTVVVNKPSLVQWLHSGLFEENECNVPLALLLITIYEQHSCDKKNLECNFRELYQFLYKTTINQPVPHLSDNSAKVLHKLLSEIMEEVWPKAQQELLNYLSEVNMYNRSAIRRTYSRKR